jgi:hypothetical protein
MKRIRWIIFLMLVVFLGLTVLLESSDQCGDCGIRPIKPITPIGCKDLKAVCHCDEEGCNCHWEWECVPLGSVKGR